MATSTTNYSFSLPEVGGDTDQWGSQLNANWTLADSTLKTIEDSVVDVTLTGNDYLTISGQAITVGDVDLTADVTGTLPVGSGGTGLTAIGSANQVLAVNAAATALEFQTLATGGTVTSVAVSGSDGIEVDSGSPVTMSGTIALGINSTTLSTHLGLGSLATQSTITESQISDLGSYITASSTDTLTNKSGNISQWTNDANYITAESNDLSAAVTWANVPDVNITQSSVTQHQAALSITESQISDLGSYQTSDAGLTSIAGLTTAADKMIYTTAADTYAVTTLTTAGRALLDDADAAAQRTTLGLGTAALSASGDFETAGAVSTHAALTSSVHGISSFGATLVDDADAAAARTTLGLGTIATQDSDSITVTGGTATLGALTVSGSDSGALVRITQTGSGNALVVEDETNPDATPFVVNSSGKVFVGTDTPMTSFFGSSPSKFAVSGPAGPLVIETLGDHVSGSRIDLLKTRGTTSNSKTIVNANDTVGVIYFGGTDGTNAIMAASINALVDGTPGTNDMPGALTFRTTADGASSLSERMRIDSSGNVGIGTSSPTVSGLEISRATGAASPTPAELRISTTTNASGWSTTDPWGRISFYSADLSDSGPKIQGTISAVADSSNGGGMDMVFSLAFGSSGTLTERMRIDSSGNVNISNLGTGTVYSDSGELTNTNPSDLNLKENVVEVRYGLSEVRQLRPVEFDWIADEADKHELGFIAQEVQLIIPDLVNTYERITNEETGETEIGYGLESTQFIPVLVKAIQEQQTLIESQQSQIDALTARIVDLENN